MILYTGKKSGFIIGGDSGELGKASQIPGASYMVRDGIVRAPMKVSIWKHLSKLKFTRISVRASQEMSKLQREYERRLRNTRNATRRFKGEKINNINMYIKTTPYNHQVAAFGFSSTLDNSALFMDQGTGKTLVAISLIGYWNQVCDINRVLVVCPKGVKPVWPYQLKTHSNFNYEVYQDSVPPKTDKLSILITNYDRIKSLSKQIKKWKPQAIVVDESHKIKNRKSSRFKQLKGISKSLIRKVIMTGTPMGKCISEVYSQYNLLDESVFSTWGEFERRYLKKGGFNNFKVVGYLNEDEFDKKIHSLSYRVTKEECLDLPELVFQRLYVKPDKITKRLYDSLDKGMYFSYLNKEVTVPSQAVKGMKFRQISGGMVKSDDESLIPISNLKSDVLKEYLEDRINDKTVIFFSFRHEIDNAIKICNKLKLGYLELSGRTPDAERNRFERRFQEDSAINVALIQVDSGAEGLTLTAADTAIFYSPSFSFINYSQARDRIYRIGQKRKSKIIFIIVEETIDERVVEVLECNSTLIDNKLNLNRTYKPGEIKMAKIKKEAEVKEVKKAKVEGYKASGLAEEFGITASELRKHLRALGATKPEAGWVWPKKTDADLVELRKQIKERLAKLSDKPAKVTKTKEVVEDKPAPKKKVVKKKAE